MIYRQRKTLHILLFFTITLILFLIVSAFIEIPFNIKTYSEVFPKEKWMLTRGNGGQIISNHIDYTKGYTAEYKMAQFERGEYVSINFREYLLFDNNCISFKVFNILKEFRKSFSLFHS